MISSSPSFNSVESDFWSESSHELYKARKSTISNHNPNPNPNPNPILKNDHHLFGVSLYFAWSSFFWIESPCCPSLTSVLSILYCRLYLLSVHYYPSELMKLASVLGFRVLHIVRPLPPWMVNCYCWRPSLVSVLSIPYIREFLAHPQSTREFLARHTFFTSVNSWRNKTHSIHPWIPGANQLPRQELSHETLTPRITPCELHQYTLPITPNHGKKIIFDQNTTFLNSLFRSKAQVKHHTVRTAFLTIVFEAKKEEPITVVFYRQQRWVPDSYKLFHLRERILSPITTLLRHARIFGTASALFYTPTTPSGYTCVRAHQIKSG